MIISTITAMPFSAFALDDEGTCGKSISYSFNSDTGVLTISGTGDMMGYDGGTSPFFASKEIRKIIVEDGVTSIGYAAFMGCESLGSVNLPSSVTSIAEFAFSGCASLTDIYYGGTSEQWNRVSIGSNNNKKFETQLIHCGFVAGGEYEGACGENAEYSFDDVLGVLFISGSGDMFDFTDGDPPYFGFKDSVKSIVIDDGITGIGYCAFYGFDMARDVDIARSVTSVGTSAFENCTRLSEIYYGNGVTLLAPAAFKNTAITEYTVADGTEIIGGWAFEKCKNLASVIIPESVTAVAISAFDGCTALSDVYYGGTSDQWNEISFAENNEPLQNAQIHYESTGPSLPENACGENAVFSFDEASGVLTISGSGDMFDYVEDEPAYYVFKDRVLSIVVEDGITSVGTYAFSGFSNVSSVELAPSVTALGTGAFENCTSLEIINDTRNITSPAPSAFKNTAITEFALADGVETIGGWIFEDCKSLKSVTIPESVSAVAISAFNGCTALSDVYYGGTREQWNQISIAGGNDCLNNATVHFAGENLPELTTGKCGDKISYSFDSETGTLTISGKGEMADYESEKDSPFYARSEIKTIVFKSGVETTGECAFNNLRSLKKITLPDTLTTISYRCFVNCTALESINFPDSLRYNGVEAFEGASDTFTITGTCVVRLSVEDYTEGTNRKWKKTHGGYKTVTTKATLSKNGSVVKKCDCGEDKKTVSTIYYPKTIALSATGYTYDGKVKKPTVSVKDSAGKTIAASNYTVTYSSGRKNVGKYAVKVVFKGNYSGTKTLSFKIIPKGTAISRLTSPLKKQMKVTWNKQATQTTGYQIQYSTDKSFKKNVKTATVSSNKTTSKTIKSLTSKKTYYVRIRTYKTVNGTKYYSAWKAYSKGVKVK